MIRVLVVDDHEIVRTGLCSYLETIDDIEVIGEAANGTQAVDMGLALSPDVILMDLLMPGKTGIEATKELRLRSCPSRIVVLTSSVDDSLVLEAIHAGALSYLLKTSSGDELVLTIRRANYNESVLDLHVQHSLVDHLYGNAKHEPWQELTDRELDVLKAIASGKSNQEIAESLYIGVKTVKPHVSSIFVKLGVQDRTQAAIYAIKHELD